MARPKDSRRRALADGTAPLENGVEVTTMSNGAVVLTAPGGGPRVGGELGPQPVAIQLWFRAGTRHERSSEHGIAHLLEHMVFKPLSAASRVGTEKPGEGRSDLSSAIEAMGGDVNAYTSHDETVYELSVDVRDVQKALGLLVRAVFRPALDKGEFAKEREVVLEEIRQYDDDPASWASERAMALAYGDDGYARPVLGTIGEVESHSARKLAGFHRRQYCLGNAVFVIVGPVPRPTLLKSIREAIEGAELSQARSKRPAARRHEPRQRPAARVTVKRPVTEAHLRLQWVGPSLRDPDSVALECAATILGEGEASRFSIRLRRGRALISDGWAAFHWLRDAGGFAIAAHTKPEQSRVALEAIVAEVQRMRTLLVEPEELERARANLRSAMVYRRETVGGLAGALGYSYVLGDSLDVERVYLERLGALTPIQVLEACQRWLDPAHVASVVVLPARTRSAARPSTGSAQPKSKPATTARVRRLASSRLPQLRELAPGIERAEFADGPTVYIAHDSSLPIIAGTAAYRGGSFRETKRTAGITNLAAALLTRGCVGRSGNELARELEGIAASLGGFCTRASAGLSFESLASHRDVTLARALACLGSAEFAEQEFLDEQRLTIDALTAEEDDAAQVCLRLGLSAAYGKHPHARMARGYLSSVASLSAKQVRSHWYRYHPLRQVSIAVAGDLDSQAVLHVIADALAGEEMSLSRLGRLPPPRRALPEKASSARCPASPLIWGKRPLIVHQRLDREQVYLNWLLPGVRIGDRRTAALEILCTTLGASSGPLFGQLREEEGLVYDVGCASFEGLDRGHVSIWASTAKAKLPKTVARIRSLMSLVASQGVGADGVAMAKELLIGGFARGLQRRGRVANLIAAGDALGLHPLRYLSYAKRIRDTTPAQVTALAREIFSAPSVLASVGARKPS